jgi:hypothetical protein
MLAWPDKEEALLNEFVDCLKLRSEAPVRSVLKGFQRFVYQRRSRPIAASMLSYSAFAFGVRSYSNAKRSCRPTSETVAIAS